MEGTAVKKMAQKKKTLQQRERVCYNSDSRRSYTFLSQHFRLSLGDSLLSVCGFAVAREERQSGFAETHLSSSHITNTTQDT
jgi:hypothetical protein